MTLDISIFITPTSSLHLVPSRHECLVPKLRQMSTCVAHKLRKLVSSLSLNVRSKNPASWRVRRELGQTIKMLGRIYWNCLNQSLQKRIGTWNTSLPFRQKREVGLSLGIICNGLSGWSVYDPKSSNLSEVGDNAGEIGEGIYSDRPLITWKMV